MIRRVCFLIGGAHAIQLSTRPCGILPCIFHARALGLRYGVPREGDPACLMYVCMCVCTIPRAGIAVMCLAMPSPSSTCLSLGTPA
ncbi:hypothetical protein F4805DRAFT_8287 [Annulohypoxylon moriforme]|nr:hypothetical protein F4805DRAFT_8287 [Annulohypoxylon moriforme]